MFNNIPFALEISTYAFHLILFYFHIIPTVSTGIYQKCLASLYCKRYIKETWLNYTIDTAENQWYDFRQSLLLLWMVLLITFFIRLFLDLVRSTVLQSLKINFPIYLIYRICFAIIFLLIIHKYQSIIMIIITISGYIYIHFILKFNWKYGFVMIWLYGITILLLKESYRLRSYINSELLYLLFNERYKGFYSWHLPANFLLLRIISYGLDYCWYERDCNACHKYDDGKGIKSVTIDKKTTDTCVMLTSSREKYHFVNYMLYMFYPPLYIAGPIITFDDFIIQAHHKDNMRITLPCK
jgi:D-alanyl-lipoteichoic acid acyltransferase DltB (MBOAT superfamily)